MPYAIGGTVLASEAELASAQAGTVTSSGISSALGFLPPQLGTVSGTAGDGGALASAQASLSALASQTSSAGITLSSIGTSVSTLSGTLASLSGVVTSYTASLSSIGTSVSTLSGTLASLSGVVTSHTASLSSIGTSVSTLSGTLASLSGVVTSHTASLSSIGTSVSTLSGTLASLSGVVTSHTASLSSIGTSVSTLSGTLASLSGVVTSHTASLSSLGTAIASTTTSLSSLGTAVVSTTTSLSSLSASLSALTPPASALLLGSSPSHGLTAVTLGSNLSLSSGTLSAAAGAAATLPSSAPLLASSATGSAVSVTIGANLLLSGGTLSASGSLSTLFTPTAAISPVLLPDFAARFTHAEDFGAVGDAVTVQDAIWSGGSTQVIFNSENIAASIVGKSITLRGGGAAGADLVTTVTAANASHPNVFTVATAPSSTYPMPTLTDVTTVVNSFTISSASHTFSSNEIGMFVAVGGVNSTITAVNGTSATLFNLATTAASGNGTMTYSDGWATVGTDDGPAINAALTSAATHGGEVLLQAKDYYIAETIVIGSAYANLRGKGPAATRIVGALGLATVVQIGTSAVVESFHSRISDLSISRAVGTPAATSYGLLLYSFNYVYLDRILFENHGWGLEMGGVPGLSISGRVTDCVFRNCTQYYMSVGSAADLIFSHLEFGTNCGNFNVVPYDDQAELYCPIGCVYIHDQPAGGGECHFNNCLFLPRGPIPYAQNHVTKGLCFHNITNGALYYLDHCYCESITSFINTDNTVPAIQGIYITSGGYTCGDVSTITVASSGLATISNTQNTNFWNLDPATTVGETMLTAVKIEGTFLLTNPFSQLTIIGGLLGLLNAVGTPSFSVTAATSGGAAGVLVMSGLTIYGDAYLAGAFDRLQVTGINHFGNGTASDTSTAGAISNKRIVGCIGDVCWADVGFTTPSSFTYATLPGASYTPGAMVWCKNARIGSQAAGAGTGSMVQSSGGAWVMMSGAAIQV